MEKIWLKSYPASIPHEIDPTTYPSIAKLIERCCEKYSTAPAFTNLGKTITYQEFDLLSRSFAAFLQKDLGLRKGDRFAIQMPNLLQYPIAMAGALRAGIVIVNTNPLYTPREMEYQFKDSGVSAILIVANFASHLEKILANTPIKHVIVTELGDALPMLKKTIVNTVVKHVKKMVPPFQIPNALTWSQCMKRDPDEFEDVALTRDDLAFLQYTGGTTGVSKGAMLTHGNIIANVEQMMACMRPFLDEGEERILTPLPLYHIFALTVNCIGFFEFGCENILITNPKDLPSLEKDYAKYKPTVVTGVNTLFNALANRESFAALDHSNLKISVGGGMAVQRAVSDHWKKITGKPICEGYGLTESSPVLSVNPINGHGKIGTIGLPVPSTSIKLCDDDGNEVPMGTPGELCAKGPQVMKGYWQRTEETAQVLTKDGWLKTGDMAIVDGDGYFKIVDRKKEMILVSGFNVYPNEIENVMALHPGVLEVAAIGVPDQKSGEAVKVFIVPKTGSLTVDDVKDFCSKNFTGYKQPKHIEFRKELPKSNVGKVLRRILKEQEPTR